ncbi:MAG: helix-turn-helix domain-containing protein [Thermodesulfobacteriota bacterium]
MNHEAPETSKPPEHPQEPLLDLKAEREARGLSLSDIFHATRVSQVNLTALESGDFERLPPLVYTRNFIRKYAQATGIDEKPILNRYERHLKAVMPPPAEPEATKPRAKIGRPYLLLLACLAIAVVAVAAYSLYLDNRDDSPALPDRSDISSPEAQTAPPSPPEGPPGAQTPPWPQPAPANQATAEAKPQSPLRQTAATPPFSQHPAGKPLHLIIEARELTWARITPDHSPPSDVLLKPGERIERWASDFFQLDIGNAGGIDVIFQGKPMGSLGKRGQVVHVRLPEGQGTTATP